MKVQYLEKADKYVFNNSHYENVILLIQLRNTNILQLKFLFFRTKRSPMEDFNSKKIENLSINVIFFNNTLNL